MIRLFYYGNELFCFSYLQIGSTFQKEKFGTLFAFLLSILGRLFTKWQHSLTSVIQCHRDGGDGDVCFYRSSLVLRIFVAQCFVFKPLFLFIYRSLFAFSIEIRINFYSILNLKMWASLRRLLHWGPLSVLGKRCVLLIILFFLYQLYKKNINKQSMI